MTYKEKYCKDRGLKVQEEPHPLHCPYAYGYENLPDDYSEGNCIHPNMECDECWNREMPDSQETKPKEMPETKEPKEKLKLDFPGFKVNDIVLLRNGVLAIVLPNHYSKNGISTFRITKHESLACVTHCSSYKNNKNCEENKSYENVHHEQYDVVKLWRMDDLNANNILADFFLKRTAPSKYPFWTETPPKKMTKEEIEEELGYSIEIVENHDEDEEE